MDELITAFHEELRPLVGVKKACALLGRVRSSYYRVKKPVVAKGPTPRASPPNALSEAERAQVLALLCEDDHVDSSVAQVYAETLDEGIYLCSQSTMLRILRANKATKDRRRQRTHPAKKRPELIATQPNEIWSWDISKLHGPTRGLFYDLYVVIDIFSRYVPGWLVAAHEDAELAKEFLEDAVLTQDVEPGQLTIHADRGGSMRSKPVSQLMMDLGITRSHSRPHVSNDNPFSEAAFKTLKYRPTFPERFGCIEDARAFCDVFFDHYNHVHRHSGIGLHTPASVHYGTHLEIREQRQTTLTSAFELNPIRFRRIAPQAPAIPEIVWINPPIKEVLANI
ncbi:MAG: IS3 family transposase [Acidimicrobiales bacterium]